MQELWANSTKNNGYQILQNSSSEDSDGSDTNSVFNRRVKGIGSGNQYSSSPQTLIFSQNDSSDSDDYVYERITSDLRDRVEVISTTQDTKDTAQQYVKSRESAWSSVTKDTSSLTYILCIVFFFIALPVGAAKAKASNKKRDIIENPTKELAVAFRALSAIDATLQSHSSTSKFSSRGEYELDYKKFKEFVGNGKFDPKIEAELRKLPDRFGESGDFLALFKHAEERIKPWREGIETLSGVKGLALEVFEGIIEIAQEKLSVELNRQEASASTFFMKTYTQNLWGKSTVTTFVNCHRTTTSIEKIEKALKTHAEEISKHTGKDYGIVYRDLAEALLKDKGFQKNIIQKQNTLIQERDQFRDLKEVAHDFLKGFIDDLTLLAPAKDTNPPTGEARLLQLEQTLPSFDQNTAALFQTTGTEKTKEDFENEQQAILQSHASMRERFGKFWEDLQTKVNTDEIEAQKKIDELNDLQDFIKDYHSPSSSGAEASLIVNPRTSKAIKLSAKDAHTLQPVRAEIIKILSILAGKEGHGSPTLLRSFYRIVLPHVNMVKLLTKEEENSSSGTTTSSPLILKDFFKDNSLFEKDTTTGLYLFAKIPDNSASSSNASQEDSIATLRKALIELDQFETERDLDQLKKPMTLGLSSNLSDDSYCKNDTDSSSSSSYSSDSDNNSPNKNLIKNNNNNIIVNNNSYNHSNDHQDSSSD
ncbi:hypothetical protein [Candidatus Neptunochlamydia vexilliferae]|uniref:Uncharacterized protein n=1 Tax=Candidatus Neptunichlamydia vexilliferae TaxID=1651774 RepID=A0ABS0B1A5_9BACT|nr:hypothetical protein [Candidatus Neptunochlamydia vexilliferae]MBF5059632.1 hypothetical protein [Candidatus Neptunochlamydia vexilliferae]